MSPMDHSILAQIIDVLLVIARLSTASFLLAMGFYLQVIAETSASPNAEPIPWQFRILPAFLGFFILHTAGRITIYPLSRPVSATILYLSLLIILIKMFQFLLESYDMESPRTRVPEFIYESLRIATRADDVDEHSSSDRK